MKKSLVFLLIPFIFLNVLLSLFSDNYENSVENLISQKSNKKATRGISFIYVPSVFEITKTSAKVSWNLKEEGGATLNYIELDRGVLGIELLPLTLKGTYLFADLTKDTSYVWTFSARADDGQGRSRTLRFDTLKDQPTFSASVDEIGDTWVDIELSGIDIDNAVISISFESTSPAFSYDLTSGYSGDGSTKKVRVEGLNPSTTYRYADIVMTYDINAGEQEEIQEIDAFTTGKSPPTVNETSIINVGVDRVELGWDISDVSDTITSMTIRGPGISTTVDSLVGSTIITGLNSNQTYSNLYISIDYSLETSSGDINADFDDFTTLKKIPIIDEISINEIGTNQVTFNWNVTDFDDAITSIRISGSDIVDETISGLSGSKTISNLKSNYQYTDWEFAIEYNDNTESKTIVQSIVPFTTLKVDPVFESAFISEIKSNQVTFNWSVNDPDDAVSSIRIYGEDITDETINGLSGSKTISGLKSNHIYSDWNFEFIYDTNDGLGSKTITNKISDFETIKSLPTVVSADVIDIEDNQATFEWDITDLDSAINSITFRGEGVDTQTITNLSGSKTITDLKSNHLYDDWALEIDYDLNDGMGVQTIVHNMGSFMTLEVQLPVVANATVSDIGSEQATFEWNIIDPGSAINFINLSGEDITDEPISVLSGSKTINGLKSNHLYDDWSLTIEYDLRDGVGVQTIVHNIASFTTLAIQPPVVANATVSDIGSEQATFEWNIIDSDNTINSISFSGEDIATELITNLSGSKTISGLKSNHLYDDWSLTIEYDLRDGAGVQTIVHNITSFMTLEVQLPVVANATVSDIGSTQVKFSWEIVDSDSTINSINFTGEGINGDLITSLKGETIIDGLQNNTEYSDWSLTIEYDLRDGAGVQTIVYNIASFTTLAIQPPTLIDFSLTDIGINQATLNWNIIDNDNTISSINISGEGISDGNITNLSGSKTVTGLESNYAYSDWTLTIEYDLSDGIGKRTLEQNISFTTLIQPPLINEAFISDPIPGQVTFNWNVEDLDEVVSSIRLVGEDVNLELGIELEGSVIITGLQIDYQYTDWTLVVEFDDKGVTKNLNQTIPNFTLENNSTLSLLRILEYIILLLLVFFILSLLLMFVGSRKSMKAFKIEK